VRDTKARIKSRKGVGEEEGRLSAGFEGDTVGIPIAGIVVIRVPELAYVA
jgi:hypothetical protein